VRYLLPNSVVDYIEANGLYLDENAPNAAASPEKGKDKDSLKRDSLPQSSQSLATPASGC